MPLYIMDGWSTRIIARRLRSARTEVAMRLWFGLAWVAAIALAWMWIALIEHRSARGRLAGQTVVGTTRNQAA